MTLTRGLSAILAFPAAALLACSPGVAGPSGPNHPSSHGIPPRFQSLLLSNGEGFPSTVFLPGDSLRVDVQATDSVGGAPWLGFRLGSATQDSMQGVIITVLTWPDGHRDT